MAKTKKQRRAAKRVKLQEKKRARVRRKEDLGKWDETVEFTEEEIDQDTEDEYQVDVDDELYIALFFDLLQTCKDMVESNDEYSDFIKFVILNNFDYVIGYAQDILDQVGTHAFASMVKDNWGEINDAAAQAMDSRDQIREAGIGRLLHIIDRAWNYAENNAA